MAGLDVLIQLNQTCIDRNFFTGLGGMTRSDKTQPGIPRSRRDPASQQNLRLVIPMSGGQTADHVSGS
jgi:hypothetical protein